MRKVNYLSLFNGISAGRLALDRAGLEVGKFYSSEIDKFANQVTDARYPDVVQLGDVNDWWEWDIDWSSIDLVTAGFPCQAWSMAGKQLGDKDPRGALFWTTLEVIGEVLKHNPNAKFMMENVKMKKEFEDYITHHTEQALGHVNKTLINSALVSAQNRNRFYWTNFEVTQPEDRGIYLKDILVDNFVTDRDKSYCIDANYFKGGSPDQYFNKSRRQIVFGGAVRGRYMVDGVRQDHKMKTAGLTTQRLEVRDDGKTNTLTTVQKDNVVVYRPCEVRENAKRSKDDMIHIADATDIKGNESNKRVYDASGKAPTLSTCQGGHREPKVAVIQTKTYNRKDGIGKDIDKALTITASDFRGLNRNQNQNCVVYEDMKYRKLTPTECARLQTFPDGWCEDIVSNTQAYKAYGNGWTVEVITHIFECAFGLDL
ncbi:DNA (cytosine-5)-methyltransferase [Proteus phage Saba]|uniref:DNA (Cytosine-5)-methyltransferase n=1 Tax=Proteus phage Saba TaxID=2596672 RepID=A0A5B9NBL3_9CAUD|nr:DNA methyltransferase [Proteus phage Saba]QEG09380.1 DNA (cytosine-5)-methyltransferase [Proteus phage Saba]